MSYLISNLTLGWLVSLPSAGHRSGEQGEASCWNPAIHFPQRQNLQVRTTIIFPLYFPHWGEIVQFKQHCREQLDCKDWVKGVRTWVHLLDRNIQLHFTPQSGQEVNQSGLWVVLCLIQESRLKNFICHMLTGCAVKNLSLSLPPPRTLSVTLSLSQSLLPNVPSYKQLDTLAVPDDGGRGGGWYLMELQSHQRLQVSGGSAHPSRRTHTLECFQ